MLLLLMMMTTIEVLHLQLRFLELSVCGGILLLLQKLRGSCRWRTDHEHDQKHWEAGHVWWGGCGDT
jgi:hypothetical protein